MHVALYDLSYMYSNILIITGILGQKKSKKFTQGTIPLFYPHVSNVLEKTTISTVFYYTFRLYIHILYNLDKCYWYF